jgi:hypothetical protein
MHRRLPSILSILLLLLVLALALWLQQRKEDPTPAPPPAPPPPAEPAPAPPPPQGDAEGLAGPSALRDRLEAYRACHARHGDAQGLPSELTLVFTVAVDPDAERRMARVDAVRVKGSDRAAEPGAFEGCVLASLADLELVAPGAHDVLEIPSSFVLGGR